MKIIFRRFASTKSKFILNFNDRVIDLSFNKFYNPSIKYNVAQWKQFRNDLVKQNCNQKVMDSAILNKIRQTFQPNEALEICKQYITAVKESNVEPTITNLNYLILSYIKKSEHNPHLTLNEEKELQEICNHIIEKSSLMLPSSIINDVIMGLSITRDWKQTITILDQVTSSRVLSSISERAFLENEADIGWEMFKKIKSLKLEIVPSAFLSYWQFCRANNGQLIQNIEKMLHFIGENGTILTEGVINKLNELLKEFNYDEARITRINENGVCSVCQQQLKPVTISTDEHKLLKDAIMKKAVVGKDIFLKSSPDELKRFLKFVEQSAPYDFVLDGLNIFYIASKATNVERAQMLNNVVKHFNKQNQRVLVIGRKHMEKTNLMKKQMNEIKTNASMFLVDDLTADDVFILYAALYSGPNTNILSRDLMRGHSYLLGPELKSIFNRWQQEHHYLLKDVPHRDVKYFQPMKYMNCEKIKKHWHIPYKNDDEFLEKPSESFEMPEKWVCLKI